jgi:hypothetical protein
MPTALNDLDALSRYVSPAMERAMCHAHKVNVIFPHIVLAIIKHAEPGTLEGRSSGDTAAGNMGWFVSKARGRRYAVVYNHTAQTIEVRERTQQGRVLHTLTNATPLASLHTIFAGL